MKFNFKNKEVLPKALRDSLKNDDVTETDEVGASNPPGAARRSRRTDVIPKDVDISHPPLTYPNFWLKTIRILMFLIQERLNAEVWDFVALLLKSFVNSRYLTFRMKKLSV